ncbi:MAG: hypothetical protein LWY06_12480 [Firmicutes bacterium]|nr:hypothetical protein [Bacillota bacterium]
MKNRHPKGRSLIYNLEFQMVILVSLAFIIFCHVYLWYYRQTKPKQYIASGTEIKKALALYAGDNSGLFPDSLQRLVPSYIKQIPECPVCHKDSFRASYTAADDRKRYSFYCGNRHNPNAGINDNTRYFSFP